MGYRIPPPVRRPFNAASFTSQASAALSSVASAAAAADRHVSAAASSSGAAAATTDAFLGAQLGQATRAARTALRGVQHSLAAASNAVATVDQLASSAAAIGDAVPLVNITYRFWLPAQGHDGEHVLSASQEARENVKHKRTGADRETIWDGEHRAYIPHQVAISETVPASAVAGLVVTDKRGDGVYWNAESYATFGGKEGVLSIERDLAALLHKAPVMQAYIDARQSCGYLGVEIEYVSGKFTRKAGKDAAANIAHAPLKASGRMAYRQSVYAEIDLDTLKGLLKDGPEDGPQRCVVDTLLQQYGPKIRVYQTDGVAGTEARSGGKRKFKRYTNVCDFTAEGLWTWLGRPGVYDGGDFAVTPAELKRICSEFDIPLSVVDGNGRPITEACFEPGRSGFARLNVMAADDHLYNLNVNTRVLARKTMQAVNELLSFDGGDNDDDSSGATEEVDVDAEGDDECVLVGDAQDDTMSMLFKGHARDEPVWCDEAIVNLEGMDLTSLDASVKVLRLVTPQDLASEVLLPLLARGIVPQVKGFRGGRPTCLALKVRFTQPASADGKTKASPRSLFVLIKAPMCPSTELGPDDIGRIEHERLTFHFGAMQSILFTQTTVSMFPDLVSGYEGSPQLGTVLNDWKQPPLYGRFYPDKPVSGHLYAYDQSKAHTSLLCEIASALPVFGYNDLFQPYNDTPIDPDALYIVTRPVGLRYGAPPLRRDSPLLIVLAHHQQLLTGRTLALVQQHPDFATYFRVHSWVRPSRLLNVKVEFKRALRHMWADPALSMASKKFIVNCLVGRLGARQTTYDVKTELFTSFDDAAMHAHRAGRDAGDVCRLDNSAFVVHSSQTRQLRDNRRPLWFAITDGVKRRNYEQALVLVEQGATLVGAKTDCLYATFAKEQPLLPKSKDVEDVIGGAHWHSEPARVLALPERPPFCAIEAPDLLPSLAPRTCVEVSLSPDGEVDAEAQADILRQHKRVFVRAVVPGAGKSTLAMTYADGQDELRGATLVVTPFHKLNAEFRAKGFEAITVYELLGVAPSDSGRGEFIQRVKRPVDLSRIRLLIIDEWAAIRELLRSLVWQHVDRYPLLQVIATGDPWQLPPIETGVNFDSEAAEVARFNDTVRNAFDCVLTLNVCKRVTSDEDHRLVYKMRDVLLKGAWDRSATTKAVLSLLDPSRFITRLDELPTNPAIVSFHVETADAIGIELASREQPKDAISVGQKQLSSGSKPFYIWDDCVLRCNSNARLGRGVNDPRLVNNGRYVVESINQHKRTARLRLDVDGGEEEEPIQIAFAGINKWFSHGAYASTGHSWQGSTIRGRPVVLVDVDSPFITRRWLWMALTRADNMGNIYVLKPSSAEAARYGFGSRDWRKFMREAIEDYKRQDSQKGRAFDEDAFVTVDDWWAIMVEAGAQCFHCSQSCDMSGERMATLDRVAGAVAHLKNNVVLSCKGCNSTRH